jgi:hypothetical protein
VVIFLWGLLDKCKATIISSAFLGGNFSVWSINDSQGTTVKYGRNNYIILHYIHENQLPRLREQTVRKIFETNTDFKPQNHDDESVSNSVPLHSQRID